MEPRQTPTYEANVPETLKGDAEMAERLAAGYFGEPFEWQRHVLEVLLARDGGDKYACRTVCLSVPRQNGKSWSIRARCFYGALADGEKILYTCQHGDTSDEMFKALSAPFEDEDEPELAAMLKAVRKTNGQQAIYLKNGGLIRFTTRTNSLARGKTYDTLIYDEAQDLTRAQQEASLPTISASAKRNAQVVYIGTPPAPENTGTVFRELHDSVHAGTSGATWLEWAVDEIGDVSDRSRWYEANPSLGLLLDESAAEGECAGMSPDGFARERLGWWSPTGGNQTLAIKRESWEACAVAVPPKDGKLAWGVKFSPDGGTVAASWALSDTGERSYVELFEVAGTGGGIRWLSDLLIRNADGIAAVMVDGKSGAASLVQRLLDGGFPRRAIIQGTSATVQAAASMLIDEVESGTVSHIDSPALDESAIKSVRREIGREGGFGFGDGANSISCPIESASLALYAARTTRRDQRRDQKASFGCRL